MSSCTHTCDNAVSPVVGVMLMLIVTVIIAALVGGFGTGLIGSLEPAPAISATAEINSEKMLSLRITGIERTVSPEDVKITITCLLDNEIFTQELYFDQPLMMNAKTTAEMAMLNEKGDKIALVGFWELLRSFDSSSGSISGDEYNKTRVGRIDKMVSDMRAADPSFPKKTQIYEVPSGTTLDLVMIYIPTGQTIFKKKLVYADLFQGNNPETNKSRIWVFED